MRVSATATVLALSIRRLHVSFASELDNNHSNPEGYVIGGDVAAKNRYHWFSGLLHMHCKSAGECNWARTACGASLIHPDILLTSAHCIPYLQDEIRSNAAYIGMHSPFITDNGGQTKEIIPFEDVIVHPDYDRFSHEHDLALIKLVSPSDVTPVKLDDGTNDMRSSTVLTALGFGIEHIDSQVLSDQLLKLDLLFVSRVICSLVYEGYYVGSGHITDDMMCAQAFRSRTDTCTGDSGGPLFIRGSREEYDVQVGVTSWSIECAQDYPGVYTSVFYHLDYINSVICQYSAVPPAECLSTTRAKATDDSISAQDIDQKGFPYDNRRGHRTSCVRLRRLAKRRRQKAKRLCRQKSYKSSCAATCRGI